MKFKLALLFVSSLYLVACAQAPMTQGDKMLVASDQAKELSNKWNQGNKLVTSGRATQKNGLSMASQGKDQMEKGRRLISAGEEMSNNGKQQVLSGARLQHESENNFDEKFPENASTNSDDDA